MGLDGCAWLCWLVCSHAAGNKLVHACPSSLGLRTPRRPKPAAHVCGQVCTFAPPASKHLCCVAVVLCCCRAVLKPRWPLQLINTGDPTRISGWYDVTCQGAINDYCRWTGTGDSSYWSCALAGREVPNTAPLQIPEQYAISTACQEVGYKGQALSDLSCGDVSLPSENLCQTRQCCKAKCDNDPRCTGFVFGNSEGNNCRSSGDGQNCCWLKGGDCRAVASPLTAAYVRAAAGRQRCLRCCCMVTGLSVVDHMGKAAYTQPLHLGCYAARTYVCCFGPRGCSQSADLVRVPTACLLCGIGNT